MNRRTTDLVLSVIAAVIAMALSWPFWRDFSFWPESETAWMIYFVLGFVLTVYVFHAFLGALHTLFEHDAVLREQAAKRNDGGAP